MKGRVEAAVLAGVLAVGGIEKCAYQWGTREQVEACITGRDVIIDVDSRIDQEGKTHVTSDEKYVVHTNRGTLNNDTAWLSGKFARDHLQSELVPGRRLLLEVYGWNFLDRLHPNVLEVIEDKGSCEEEDGLHVQP